MCAAMSDSNHTAKSIVYTHIIKSRMVESVPKRDPHVKTTDQSKHREACGGAVTFLELSLSLTKLKL
jgi:hypothetical protein